MEKLSWKKSRLFNYKMHKQELVHLMGTKNKIAGERTDLFALADRSF